ncbi:LURP-one-related family protein [Arthrobacter sp. U41]|uniref:LURP-one-related family protein n=1 Tax=Arthrobacter sp. U41 TaxID=1849032 RepID=UPI0011A3F215|nr:LURP-one-related family protein [Arthrobacter sp. U41]
MGLLRHGDKEPAGERFVMREKLMSIGDDFWIENGQGQRAYKVNGKALHLRDTFVLEDVSGAEPDRSEGPG